jgi:hypothetical protein
MNEETKTLAAITTMMAENRLVYSCYTKHHPFTGAQPIVFYEVSAMPNKKLSQKNRQPISNRATKIKGILSTVVVIK